MDAVQIEVLRNRLEAIADGSAITLARSGRSVIARQCLDFSNGILSTSGELIAQALTIPAHLSSMPPALEACLRHYEGNIHPGDILINNDPYEGAMHPPDIYLFKPFFAGGIVLCYLGATVHHQDMGGSVPGSSACDSTEIYQEGLRIPPLKLYDKGEPSETLFRILEKAVRVPEMVLGDLQAELAALRYGEQELTRLLSRSGPEEFLSQLEELLNYTEELTRKAIRTLPEGSWEFTDYISDDPITGDPIPIVANLTKRGDEIHVDFTGTGPQARGAINPPFQTSQGSVYITVRTLLGSLGWDIPNTGGYFRPVKVTAPPGTYVHPILPAPVTARNIGLVRIYQTLMGAFAQMLPDKVTACTGGCEIHQNFSGYDKSRTPWKAWVMGEAFNEIAGGAFPWRDGFDLQMTGITNLATVPLEEIEAEYPIKIEEFAALPDMEGPGKFRGGTGMVRTYRVLADDTILQMRSDRRKYPAYGLSGGLPAATSDMVVNPGTPGEHHLPSKFVVHFKAGDVIETRTPGGGGWGDPLERDPESVLRDFLAERITVGRAQSAYGVIIDLTTHTVDYDATRRVRQQLRPPKQVPAAPAG